MKRGDAVRTPQGIGRLWSTQDDLVIVELDYRYRVAFHRDLVSYDGWKMEAPPAAPDYIAICTQCQGEIETEEDVVDVEGEPVCGFCAREDGHV